MSSKKQPLFTPLDRANLRWFWEAYLRAKTPWLVLVFVLIILQGLVYQQFLRLTENGLRVIFENGTIRDLVVVCLTVFGVFMFRGVMSFLIPRISAWIAGDAVKRLRVDMIAHMMRLDLAYFESAPPGEVILKLVGQAEQLSAFVGQNVVKAARDAATVVILSVYLLYKQPILFLSAAIVLPAIFFAMQAISRRIKGIQRQSQQATADFISAIEETVGGMRTVKISGQERAETQRLSGAANDIKRLTIRMQTAQAMVQPFVDFGAAFVYMLVIGGGGYMVLSPAFDIDGAGIIAFLLGLVLVFDPGRRLAQFVVTLQAGLVILDHIRALYREVAGIQDAPDATEDFDQNGDLVLRDVRFGYGEETLFDRLNLRFKGGQRTAIVGPTGSGKTTILSLLGRLYDVSAGAIDLGGEDLRKRRLVALTEAGHPDSGGDHPVGVDLDSGEFERPLGGSDLYVRTDADTELQAGALRAPLLLLSSHSVVVDRLDPLHERGHDHQDGEGDELLRLRCEQRPSGSPHPAYRPRRGPPQRRCRRGWRPNRRGPSVHQD